eukprot:8712066-Pyramimonas_sp.AAC.1
MCDVHDGIASLGPPPAPRKDLLIKGDAERDPRGLEVGIQNGEGGKPARVPEFCSHRAKLRLALRWRGEVPDRPCEAHS